MQKLKLQSFSLLLIRANSSEKTLMLGKNWRQEEKGGSRGWDRWMASLTQWTWVSANSRRQWRTGKPHKLQFMGSQRVGHGLVTKQHVWRLMLIYQANVIWWDWYFILNRWNNGEYLQMPLDTHFKASSGLTVPFNRGQPGELGQKDRLS